MDQGDFNPADIEVFVGVDMAKGDHYAQAITTTGEELFDRPVANDEMVLWIIRHQVPLDIAAVVGKRIYTFQ